MLHLDALCITVRRGSICDDTIFAPHAGFDEKKHIKVRFLGEFVMQGMHILNCTLPRAGEPGIDEGGPKREYFMLLLNVISNNNSLLDGSPSQRVLWHNTSAFQVNISTTQGWAFIFIFCLG